MVGKNACQLLIFYRLTDNIKEREMEREGGHYNEF